MYSYTKSLLGSLIIEDDCAKKNTLFHLCFTENVEKQDVDGYRKG